MPPCDSSIEKTAVTLVNVSILVLVDAALRPQTTHGAAHWYQSFNPCFSGCRPATQNQSVMSYRRGIVSILVLVDAALRPLTVRC